jgi:hypothetical protein
MPDFDSMNGHGRQARGDGFKSTIIPTGSSCSKLERIEPFEPVGHCRSKAPDINDLYLKHGPDAVRSVLDNCVKEQLELATADSHHLSGDPTVAADELTEAAFACELDRDAIQSAIVTGANCELDGWANADTHAADVLRFPKPAQRGLKLWWHGEPSTNHDRTWIVEGLLPEVGTALVSGQWGTYKTFVVVDLALSLMAGQTFAGRAVNRRCGVLFIAAEGAYEIPLRLQCAYEEKYPESNSQLPFAMADECPRVLDRNALPILQETAAAANEHMRTRHGVEIGLIIVDTMAAAAGFNDENDNAEAQRAMNVFTALSRQFKCLVIPVDHFGKLAETGTRGGSAKEGSVDAILAVLGDKDLSGNVTNPRMAVRKVRGAQTGTEIPFGVRVVNAGVDSDGSAETTLVIDWRPESAAVKAPRERWPPSLCVFRDALVGVLLDHGAERRPFPDGPLVRCVDRETVRSEFYRRCVVDGDTETKRQEARKKQYQRALQMAQVRKLIGVVVEGDATMVWLCSNETATA